MDKNYFAAFLIIRTIGDIESFFPVDQVKKMENKRQDSIELLRSKATVTDTGSCWSLEHHFILPSTLVAFFPGGFISLTLERN